MKRIPASIRVVVFLLLLVPAGLRGETVIAYRAVGTSVEALQPVIGVGGTALPSSLVIPPGRYAFYGNAFDLDRPGLYRFMSIPLENQQRIVFNGDVDALISAVAWINAHGSGDDSRPLEDLEALAKMRKLSGTCGTISRLAQRLLERAGISTRLVFTYASFPHGGFDDGHIMLEVFVPKARRWILYDLDNKSVFTLNGSRLSFREFAGAVRERAAYTIDPVAGGSNLDERFQSEGYSYVFYAELAVALESTRRVWYERITRFVAIDEGNYLYVRADAGVEALLQKDPSLRPLTAENWNAKFYPMNGGEKRGRD